MILDNMSHYAWLHASFAIPTVVLKQEVNGHVIQKLVVLYFKKLGQTRI